jgi:hypothetical protein
MRSDSVADLTSRTAVYGKHMICPICSHSIKLTAGNVCYATLYEESAQVL